MKQMFKKSGLNASGARGWTAVLYLLLLCAQPLAVRAQQVLVNLGSVDGIELTPDNIFNYQIQSSMTTTVRAIVKGKLVYRANGLSFSYSFPYTIRPGINVLDPAAIHPQWTFSSGPFRELFTDYKKLPAGTYEYCVEVSLQGAGGETIEGSSNRECLYRKSDEVFLINLVDPENNAKLHEYFPMFSWIVNYPFAAALTYNIRIAEVKDGQNNTAAVNRNNPIYQEKNIPQTSVGYPVYAKPLEPFTPYAWTVDAYYKGILLGGAEPWRFTIIEDSIMNSIPRDISYLDLKLEKGKNSVFALGVLKLKYNLTELLSDSLSLKLLNREKKEIRIKHARLIANKGDNRYEIDFTESPKLKHLEYYILEVINMEGERFKVLFRYVNPDFLK